MSEQLKKYMDKLDSVPPIIRKSANEIHELDQKTDSIMLDIKQRTMSSIKNYRKLSRDNKAKLYKELQGLFKEVEKIAEKKVTIAQKMYDMVDNNIREIDKHVEIFNEYQMKKYAQEENKINGSPVRNRKQASNQKTDKKKKSGGADLRCARIAETGAIMETFKPKPIQIQPAMDMPVDPSEPRYCICHQVSFGQMVACDNKDCPYEWFHFQCVGLTKNPPGQWFCDKCRENMKKKK